MDAAINYFIHNVGRLAFVKGLLPVHDAFAFNQGRVQAGGVQSDGAGGRDLHGQVAGEFQQAGLGKGFGFFAAQFHHNADFAVGVHIGAHQAGRFGLNAREAADGHILAQGGDLVGQGIAHQSIQSGRIGGFFVKHRGRHFSGKGLELVATGNKVRFAHDFDKSGNAVIRRDFLGDGALGGGAAGLFGRLGKTLLAQPVNGLFHVAIRFFQGFFAVHHARAGAFAQFLNHGSGNIRHL